MKTKKLATTEKYSTVAVRSKLSVEVEQRKRLGAWAKRVLVLDGATLYAYKTKGDGGSVGGWAIGGADVHVRRGNDSNRDDGRHILVIARPPVYKLVFAFTTTYEQARMIQALSSSGATVTGLDAIMLLKNLRQQQEQEQKEKEERQRQQNGQTSREQNNDANGNLTSNQEEEEDEEEEEEDKEEDEEGEEQETLTNDNKKLSLDNEENEKLVEIREIDESIYDQSSDIVSNPLYSSLMELPSGTLSDRVDGGVSSSSNSSHSSTSTSEASGDLAMPPPFHAVSANRESEDKVNPVPKPPRASVSEGSPTNYSTVPENGNKVKNVNKIKDDCGEQSVLSSVSVQEDLSGDVSFYHQGSSSGAGGLDEFGKEVNSNEDTVTEAKNSLYSIVDEDSEEGEGFYQVNLDPEGKKDNAPKNGQYPQSTLADKDREEEEELDEESFASNYVELVNKMKLERGLLIESQSGGHLLDGGSPERVRKLLGDSPLSDVSNKSPSPVHELGNEKEESQNEDGKNVEKMGKVEVPSVVCEEVLSDSDEKFEQLYRELSSNYNTDVVRKSKVINTLEHTIDKITDTENQERDEKPTADNKNTSKEKQLLGVKDVVDSTNNSSSQNETPLKRVSSIIKKKGSPGTGKSKKVQFNLNATTTIVPDSSSHTPLLSPKDEREKQSEDNEMVAKDETVSKTSSPMKAKKDPLSASADAGKRPSAVDPPTKKKSEGPATSSTSPSPTKKKGIFSSIFSNSSPKKTADLSSPKEDASKKKDSSPVKIDASIKRPPVTSQANLKRQPTVDLTAPLMIGGSVEMGGSINGKVSPRLIEVRDGHVLAFMPKSSSPTSRLSLLGLSVTPMIGGIHSNSLSLTRASRCMMVIKLSSRDEMMRWINVLSDEVIKATPEKQRVGLVLYPSPKIEEPEKKHEDDDADDADQQPGKHRGPKETKDKMVVKKIQEIEKKKEIEKKLALPNGHNEERTDISNVQNNSELKKAPHSISNGEGTVNVETEVAEEGEDTSDGWRRKKPPIVEQFEMEELPKAGVVRAGDSKVTTTISSDLNVVEEHFKEEKKEGEQTVRRINKLNIEERWKEHVETRNKPQKGDSPMRRRSADNKLTHPPLKRLSGQDFTSSQSKVQGQDTVGNLLFFNNPPKRDYHANCHPPLERLSNHNRILSASESNLRKAVDTKPTSNIHHLHRFGSELTLQEKTKKEFNNNNNNTLSGTKDNSKLLVSSRIMRNQVNASKTSSHQGRINGTSPTSSPSHTRSRKFVTFEPRKVEIIESQGPINQKELSNGISEIKEEEDQWYDEDEPTEKTPEPSKRNSDELPGITWSVAETREKFELLCSVSGENKTGKLTTKTPISRKRSARSSVKKRRSLEGGSGRRPNARKGVKRSLQATFSNNTSSPVKSSSTHTSSKLQQGGPFKPQLQGTSINRSTSSPVKPTSTDTSSSNLHQEDTFNLQPVRDRRKTFERDNVDSPDSDLYKSTSSETISDIGIIDHNDKERPASPLKSPLRRTQNVLSDSRSPSSSPEPALIRSKQINGRPRGSIPEKDKGVVSRSLATESQINAERDSEVVICWKGPYIAQESDTGQNSEQNAEHPKRDRKEPNVETEQAVLSNISNAFLAKRRLLSREVAVARIQEKLSTLEENIWDIQASMAELDTQRSLVNTKASSNWKALEKSLRTAEEEMTYWTSRLMQTQKEADQAREKLAAALVTGLAQYNSNDHTQQRHTLLKQDVMEEEEEEEEKGEEDCEVDRDNEEDSFA